MTFAEFGPKVSESAILWTVHVIQSCIMITVMYHESRHELYYTGNTIIIELNRIQIAHVRQNTLEIYVAKYQ